MLKVSPKQIISEFQKNLISKKLNILTKEKDHLVRVLKKAGEINEAA